MRLKKNFPLGKGKYYFQIKAVPNNITIFRKTRQAALQAFQRYKALGKDIEWLGKWDGQQFTESAVPGLAV